MTRSGVRRRGTRAAAGLIVAAAALTAWRPADASCAGRPVRVFAGIPPIAGLAERIGGDRVSVETLLRPGDNPHTFEPKPRQVAALGRADLYAACGFPFEANLRRKLENASAGPAVAALDSGLAGVRREDGRGHGSPAPGAGGPDEADPHIWLSPALLRTISLNLFEALKRRDPGSEPYFRSNLDRLLSELDSLDRANVRLLEPFRGRSFLAAHPSFGRFAEAYGLRQMSVESEGRSPSPRTLTAIVRKARAEGIRVVFTEPQFDPAAARAVADAIGGSVVAVDPLAADPLKTIGSFADTLARSFRVAGGKESAP
jgi:zinc transport system substrate-binding protein